MNVLRALWSIRIISRHIFFQGVTAWQCNCTECSLVKPCRATEFSKKSSSLFDARCVEFAGDAFGTFGCGISTGTSAGDKHCRRAPCGFCFGFCSGFFCRPESHWRPDCGQTRYQRRSMMHTQSCINNHKYAYITVNDVGYTLIERFFSALLFIHVDAAMTP